MGRMAGQAVLRLSVYRYACDMTPVRQIATVSSVSAVSTGQLLHRRHLLQVGVGDCQFPMFLCCCAVDAATRARPANHGSRTLLAWRREVGLSMAASAWPKRLSYQTSTLTPLPLNFLLIIILFARDRFSDLSFYTAATSPLQLLQQQSSSSTLNHTQDKQDGRHQEGACHQS